MNKRKIHKKRRALPRKKRIAFLKKYPSFTFLAPALFFLSFYLILFPLPTTRQIKETTQIRTFAQEKDIASSSALLDTITPTIIPLATVPPPPLGSYCVSLPIILYHHIEPLQVATEEGHAQLTVDNEIFDAQMQYLKESGYHTVSLDEVVQALQQKSPLPEKSIAITIDDGYKDNYEYAYQILKKYGMKGNFMIPTGLIMNPGYMSWDNLREIHSSGLGFLYNHTWSHAALGNSSEGQIEAELSISQTQFQEQLGITPTIFIYPYGSFSTPAIEALKKHGFVAAFTTISGRLQCDSAIYTLYREHVGNAPLSSYDL